MFLLARRGIERNLGTLQKRIVLKTQLPQLFNIRFATCSGLTWPLSGVCTCKTTSIKLRMATRSSLVRLRVDSFTRILEV